MTPFLTDEQKRELRNVSELVIEYAERYEEDNTYREYLATDVLALLDEIEELRDTSKVGDVTHKEGPLFNYRQCIIQGPPMTHCPLCQKEFLSEQIIASAEWGSVTMPAHHDCLTPGTVVRFYRDKGYE